MKAYVLSSGSSELSFVDKLKEFGFSVCIVDSVERLASVSLYDTDCIFIPLFFQGACVLPLARKLCDSFPHITIFVYHTKEELYLVRHCIHDDTRFILYDVSSKQTIPSVIADTQIMNELKTLIVLKGICREPGTHMIKNAFAYILRNFKEVEHDDVYRSLNLPVTEAVFNRKFKEECSITVTKLIRSLRLEYAAYLTRKTNLSLGEIAQSCGYRNYYRFSKIFKTYHRKPFTSYRRLYGNQSS